MCIICLLFLDNNIEKSRAATGKGNNINKKRLNAKQCIIHRPVVRQARVFVCARFALCMQRRTKLSRSFESGHERKSESARAADAADCCKFISGRAGELIFRRGVLKYCQEPYRWTKGHQEGCLLLRNPHDSRVINFSHFQLKAELEVKRSNCHHYSCLIAFCFQ